MKKMSRRAMTLIELLVSISIMSLLVAILLPAVQSAREAARKTQCANNLRQIGLGVHNFLTFSKSFPQGMYHESATEKNWSWFVEVLPYIEQQNLRDMYKKSLSFDDPGNTTAVSASLPMMRCPSGAGAKTDQLATGVQATVASYHPCAGIHPMLVSWLTQHGELKPGLYQTVFGKELTGGRFTPIGVHQVSDGLSNTWMLIEADGAPQRWHDDHAHELPRVPGGSPFDVQSAFVIHGITDAGTSPGPYWALSNGGGGTDDFDKEPFSFHSGVIMVLRADGGVEAVSNSINLPIVLKKFAIADGE